MLKRTVIGVSIAFVLTLGTAAAQRAPASASLQTSAQTPTEAVNQYTAALQNRDGRGVAAVFHPQAMLHSIQGNSPGRSSSATFASGVRLGGLFGGGRPRSPALKSTIKIVDTDASAGVVRVDLDFGTDGIIDYLMVARIGQDWRIISKVFEGPNQAVNADLVAARRPIETFIASRSTWDVSKFATSIYDTAQIFTVSADQLNVATVAQAKSEYGNARSVYQPPEDNGVIDTIETLGTTGYARFHATKPDGTIVNRAAFLLKNRTEWRIISLHTWTAVAPTVSATQ